ncbi:MAG TPA: pantetheine-phosphate adenylyltransferase [Dehalococcoidia bacterium]
MARAVYPGKFDPVTNGHLDIVKRAASLFDHLIVAVYDQPQGGTLFTTDERVALYREAVKQYENVTVQAFSGLMVDFARRVGATFIVRGIRAVTGFEYEFDMALMNKKMAPEIESVYLMASLEHLFVSASRIREVAGLGHDVTNLVPPHVAAALRKKFSHG